MGWEVEVLKIVQNIVTSFMDAHFLTYSQIIVNIITLSLDTLEFCT